MNTPITLRRITLGITILTFVLAACRCSVAIGTDCASYVRDMLFVDPSTQPFMSCGEYVSAICPDADSSVPGAVDAEIACISAAAESWYNGGVNPPVPNYPTDGGSAPPALDFGGGNNIVAPPVIPNGGNSNVGACDGFAITEPNDGLANGRNFINWTVPNTNARLRYILSVYDEHHNLLISWTIPLSPPGLNPDLSQGYIGGAFEIIIEVTAQNFDTEQVICTTSRHYLREANPPPADPGRPFIVVPTPVILPTIEPPR